MKSVPPTRTPAVKDVPTAIGAFAVLRADTNDGEVAGAAADVGDQRQLLAANRLLIVVGGRDGFVHERHVAEATSLRQWPPAYLPAPAAIGPGLVIDEAHRSAVHDGSDLLPGERFGLVFQMAHEDLDDFGERHLAAASRLVSSSISGEPRIDFSARRISRPSVCPT